MKVSDDTGPTITLDIQLNYRALKLILNTDITLESSDRYLPSEPAAVESCVDGQHSGSMPGLATQTGFVISVIFCDRFYLPHLGKVDQILS